MVVNTDKRDRIYSQEILKETEEWMRSKREKLRLRRSLNYSAKELSRENIHQNVCNMFVESESVQTCQLRPADTFKLRSSSVTRVKTREYETQRPHSVDIGGIERKTSAWLEVMPSHRVRVRNCDEPPDEFKRAGIGVCFKGRDKLIYIITS
jgi:hypothetical protein